MNKPSRELEERIRRSFALQEPERQFCGCQVAEDSGTLIARIYSQPAQNPRIPIPYQIFRFDPVSGSLSLAGAEDAAPFIISNYR